VLVGAAEAIDHSRRMRSKGIAGGEPAIAWSELIKFKRTFTEPVLAMKEKNLAKNGIDAYQGRAKFRGSRSVEVGGEVLEGEKMAALCREFDVSRKTDYKIFHRYKDCGLEGLTDRSRRPYWQLALPR